MTVSNPTSNSPPRAASRPPASAVTAYTVIQAYPGIRIEEVARALGMSVSAVEMRVTALRGMGFVERYAGRAFDGWRSTGAWDSDFDDLTRTGETPRWPYDYHEPLDWPVYR